MTLSNCPTCEQILAGADQGIIPSEWKRYWPYILVVVVILAALYLYKRRKKG